MTKFSQLSLKEIVNGIKNKEFTSEEVTKSFIENSKKLFKTQRRTGNLETKNL